MGLVRGHGEADIEGPHVFLAGDWETIKKDIGLYQTVVMGRERFKGSGDSGRTNIH